MYDWTIDFFTLGAYLIAVTVIGALTARKVTSASTFFMGERKFGKWMMTMFTFGTGTSTDQAVTTVAKTYTIGASGIWYQWLWIFATPVITDFIQGILTVVLSFLILPFALQAVGGLDGLRTLIDDPSFFDLISDAPGT